VRYELNGVIRHNRRDVVVGMGVMHMEGQSDGFPFTITISPASRG
jgi:hypothetical protein